MPWLKDLAIFGRELISNPGPIGAACPSSPGLARRMARMVGSGNTNLVLEIGAGTGAITSALLETCVPSNRLIIVERSAPLVKLLRERFPGVRVIEGDACQLRATLAQAGDIDPARITHVVSSLPFRSLPPEHVGLITGELADLLSHGAQLVQFTYNLFQGSSGIFGQLCRQASSVVWLNVPPARVEVFRAASAELSSSTHPAPPGGQSGKLSFASDNQGMNDSPRE